MDVIALQSMHSGRAASKKKMRNDPSRSRWHRRKPFNPSKGNKRCRRSSKGKKRCRASRKKNETQNRGKIRTVFDYARPLDSYRVELDSLERSVRDNPTLEQEVREMFTDKKNASTQTH